MAYGKWIGGVLGLMTGGPLGAFAGYFIGSIIDNAMASGDDRTDAHTSTDYDSPFFNGASPQAQAAREESERNSFLFSLMVLSSYVIQADARIMHSEMEYVRRFLRTNFGPAAEEQGEQILRRLFEESKKDTPQNWRQQIKEVCQQLHRMMPEAQRQQLVTYLMDIAKADGVVTDTEVGVLRDLASWMGLLASTIDELNNLGRNTIEAAYEALGIRPDATDAEVREAYKRMALKYHPDRVATLGEDVRRSAEENFKRINNAKERIFAARGMR
jgi:DnaJ like chaperone protein